MHGLVTAWSDALPGYVIQTSRTTHRMPRALSISTELRTIWQTRERHGPQHTDEEAYIHDDSPITLIRVRLQQNHHCA
jgi:hypothetical protein